MKPLVLALSVVGLVFVAAACGGNDGAKSAGPVPSVPVEAEPPTAPAASPVTVSGVPAAPEGLRDRPHHRCDDCTTRGHPPIAGRGPQTAEGSGQYAEGSGQYAASSDGSQLAYVGSGQGGEPQIFVADIDGGGVRQVTHDPKGAKSPAWSPDGKTIAYLTATDYRAMCGGCWWETPGKLRVLDVATGESTQILDEAVWGVQFTPDGSSLLYTTDDEPFLATPTLRTVPVAGGESTLFIGPDGGLSDAGGGSISPDGARVTYSASGTPRAPDGTLLTTIQGEPCPTAVPAGSSPMSTAPRSEYFPAGSRTLVA